MIFGYKDKIYIFALGNFHVKLRKILQASGGAIAGDYFFS